jgi:hypothetical protein
LLFVCDDKAIFRDLANPPLERPDSMMRAALEDIDPIGVKNGRQPMGDQDRNQGYTAPQGTASTREWKL